jgi:hypothetical protein
MTATLQQQGKGQVHPVLHPSAVAADGKVGCHADIWLQCVEVEGKHLTGLALLGI